MGAVKEAPPEYAAFTIQQELYKRFGWIDETIARKPARQVEDYIEFIRLIIHNEEAEHKRAQSRAKSR